MYEDLEIIDSLGVDQADSINNYISEHYPWLPTRMDFSKIPNSSHIRWGKVSDEKVEEFILSSPLSEFEYVAVLYSYAEPILIYKLRYAAKEFDYISKGKQIFLVLGVVKNNGKWNIDKSNLIYAHTGFDI